MLSLTTASTRPSLSSGDGWENPSTDSTSAPALRAISAQLLVGYWAVRLPFRSASDLIELSSLRVTITPCEIEYGSERSYSAFAPR